MFTNLGVIDWLALAFAALLLAGAAAAAVLAYVTSRARTSVPKNGYAHAATATPAATTLTASKASVDQEQDADEETDAGEIVDDSSVIDLRNHRPQHATVGSSVDAADSLADGEVVPLHATTPPKSPSPTIRRASSMPPPIVHAQGNCDEDVPADLAPEPVLAGNFSADSEIDREAQLASRAARLRGRPVAETSPPTDISEARTYKASKSDIDVENKVGETPSPDRVGFERRTPGFFEDPMGRHELRYWDGSHWTEYVKESGERFTDPL